MKQLLNILFFVYSGLFLGAQSTKFVVSVNKNPISTGERLVVNFELMNGNGTNFIPPSFHDFKLLGGPNQSSSYQFVNGRTSSSQSFSYILMPYKEGEFTIGSASIVADGKKMQTDPISIKVTKGSAVPQTQNNTAPSQNKPEPKAEKANGNVFIKLFVDRSKIYKGEQIMVTYKIYTRANIVDYDFASLPAYDGFWSKDVDLGQVSLKPENVNGATYYAAILKKNILFPQRAGRLVIDPMKMEVVLRMKEQGNPYDVFDQFFGRYKDVKFNIESDVLSVDVMALPETGKPASFNGAVGKFNFDVQASKTKVKANDAINFKMKVNGSGNIHLVELDKLNFPADFEQYDPKISDQTSISSGTMSGKKEWDYLVIPRAAGNFSVGPFKFSYFDPQKKKYIEMVKDAISVDVEKDLTQQNAVSFNPSVQQKEIQTLSKDIRFIRTDDVEFQSVNNYFFGSFLHVLLLLVPAIALAVLMIIKHQDDRLRSDVSKYKKVKANKVALARMSLAKKAMELDQNSFYEELYKGLLGYISDKFSIQTAHLTQEIISQELKKKNYSEHLIQETLDVISYAEMARFSPVKALSNQELYQKAIDVIGKLEGSK